MQVVTHPRYVDMDKCIACGACSDKCPQRVPNEYNEGLNKRKAAHVQYAQAVPLKYSLDSKNCIYFLKGKCKACEKFCPTGAINYEDTESEREIQVGSVIISAGFKAFDPTGYSAYSYSQFANVVTALEFERILAASGPWMGHLVRPGDEKEPQKIAWLQCVGSRDTNTCDHPYCSAVCCMYAIKEAALAKEHAGATIWTPPSSSWTCAPPARSSRSYYEPRPGREGRALYPLHGCTPSRWSRLPIRVNLRMVHFTTAEAARAASEEFDLVVLSIRAPDLAESTVALAERHEGIELNSEPLYAQTSLFPPRWRPRGPGIFVCGALARGPRTSRSRSWRPRAAAC